MKISILTFSQGDNYGAVLQSYGLGEFLRRKGYTVEYINLTWSSLRYTILSKLTPLPYRFKAFRKKYLRDFSKSCKCTEDLKDSVTHSDLCIVGSDQVWNPQITTIRALHYFFDFLPLDKPRISYAASFGLDNWPDPSMIEPVRKLLTKFDAISVRENVGVDICRKTFGQEATLVIDPTLLLGDFSAILKKPKHKDKIVGFMFKASKSYYSVLEKIGHLVGSRVLLMDLPRRRIIPPLRKFSLSPCSSVEDWVTNIANARMVITDSFHCLAMSIIFNREFFFIANNPKLSSRATSLLEALNIEGRIFYSIEDFYESFTTGDHIVPLDYNTIQLQLKNLRASSIDFLDDVLSKYSDEL